MFIIIIIIITTRVQLAATRAMSVVSIVARWDSVIKKAVGVTGPMR
jgi:hypothetical protein